MIYNDYNLGTFLVVLLAVVISFTLHEYAHARVAAWNGDYTAKYEGRLTLNPLKHIDPIGFIMLITVGFGFAKPVPVRATNFRKITRGIFTVAIAGITVNLLLALFSAPLYLLCWRGTVYGAGAGAKIAYFFANFFSYMMVINVSLALFNLIPLYPLDGFRVLEALTKYKNPITKFLREYGYYILIGLIGVSMIIDIFRLTEYSPVFYYLDIIGLYIGRVGGFISEGILWFWRLIIKI